MSDRYEANIVDALDWVFDNADCDDPTDEELTTLIKKGIQFACKELERHLTEHIDDMLAEARGIFDDCLEEEE